MLRGRLALALALIACGVVAHGQQASIELAAFPSIGVADGRSTLTLTAEVRDGVGRLVRDGTQVVFEAERGTFLNRNIVSTQSGLAQITMVSPSQAGTVRVKATVFSLNASTAIEIEFFADRTLLDSAQDYIEIVSSGNLSYSPQHRLFESLSGEGEVNIEYRDITIKCQSVQVSASTYEVRASGAEIDFGGRKKMFQQLYIRLDRRKGIGIATEEGEHIVVHRNGPLIALEKSNAPRLAVYEITSNGFNKLPSDSDLRLLNTVDMSGAISFVRSSKAVVFPSRQIQFHRANVVVNEQTVLSLPLFQLSTSTSTPLVTEQFLNISNSSLNVNYPHYLSLKPGETSLLRFRYGQRSGVGLGSTAGMFMDYELNWNRGFDSQGGLTLNGIARNDWGLSLRQAWTGKTSVNAQLDFPAHKSLFANVSLTQPVGDYRLNLNGQRGQSIAGERFETNNANVSVERRPMRLGGLPASMTYGVSAGVNKILNQPASQRVEFQVRADSDPLIIDARNSLRLSTSLGVVRGRNVTSSTTRFAQVGWDADLGNGLVASSTYEYTVDGFTDDILGTHRVGSQLYWRDGPLSASAYLSQGLDIDRFNVSGSLDYRLSGLWRLSYGFYRDRYQGEVFGEQTIILGYLVGFREVGLSYSTRTKRIGLELLGTRFN
ncbi:MAG: invasin domain 3-containing protein [Fimbriimonadaceae bacterium]